MPETNYVRGDPYMDIWGFTLESYYGLMVNSADILRWFLVQFCIGAYFTTLIQNSYSFEIEKTLLYERPSLTTMVSTCFLTIVWQSKALNDDPETIQIILPIHLRHHRIPMHILSSTPIARQGSLLPLIILGGHRMFHLNLYPFCPKWHTPTMHSA
jgi:hypothetical protein